MARRQIVQREAAEGIWNVLITFLSHSTGVVVFLNCQSATTKTHIFHLPSRIRATSLLERLLFRIDEPGTCGSHLRCVAMEARHGARFFGLKNASQPFIPSRHALLLRLSRLQ